MTAPAPGEVLGKRLKAMGVTPTELARQVRVPANRITQIVNGRRGITGDSALRLAHWFGDKPEFWMALQARHDIEVAKAEAGLAIDELPTSGGGVRPSKRRTPKKNARSA